MTPLLAVLRPSQTLVGTVTSLRPLSESALWSTDDSNSIGGVNTALPCVTHSPIFLSASVLSLQNTGYAKRLLKSGHKIFSQCVPLITFTSGQAS